jgi:hypothetical protein
MMVRAHYGLFGPPRLVRNHLELSPVAQFDESFPPAAVRFADPNPLANCFKTGTLADLPRVPEDAVTLNNRSLDWHKALTPQNYYHCWLLDQIAATSVRIEHLSRVERRARDRVVLRSQLFWDDDRRLDAETLGGGLASAPVQVVNQLRRTPHGCDWMIDRWARLARVADANKPWDQARISIAFDLLGTPAEDRDGILGEVIDQEGRVVSSPRNGAELARREIAALQTRKEEVAGLDVLDRALTEADYMSEPTPEIRQIRRRNAELHRYLKWYVSQSQAKPTYPYTKPEVYDFFRRSPELETPPQLQTRIPTAPLPGKQIANDETDENGNTWQYLVNARRDAEELKKQAREEARMEKRIQRRA